MSAIGGPNIVEDGLVLALDAANVKSFRGEPAINLLTGINNSFGTQDTALFKTNYGSEIVDIPAIGKRLITYVNIFNDFNGGSGNCCPAPFSFGDFSVSPSTTYTYQIIFRTSTSYSHPNYMYQYQYNGGTYVTEFGLLSGSRIEDLGDGWKHGWGTFTTNSSTNRLITYLFHYEYGTFNKIQVGGIMLSQRSSPVNPKFILPTATSRGTTVATGGGWTDRSGNSNHGELVNGPTFDNDNLGSLVFDGVNDRVECGTFSVPFLTVSTWVYKTSSATNQGICRKERGWAVSNYQGVLQVAPGTSWTFYNTGYTIPLNTWVNIVYTYSGTGATGSQTVYINGLSIYSTSAGSGAIAANTNPVRVGFDDNNWYWHGGIAQTQIYNRALTQQEIQQNYIATKSRYGL